MLTFFVYLKMKKYVLIPLLIIGVLAVAYQLHPINNQIDALVGAVKSNTNLINVSGITINSRVKTPEGYKRPPLKKGSFQDYLRGYKLKPFGAKIINYDDTEYYWQQGHVGVLDIPVPKNGLQQCADALIRIRSEYLWDNDRKDEIGFNFTSGHYCSWLKYAEGYRPKIKGNNVSFFKSKASNHTKSNFYKYLNLIYMYSGTLSLSNELTPVLDVNNLEVGDVLIKGGSPGHIVMLADVAINDNNEKLFLLFQGNTPAQSVHLVKNLEENTISPWYDLKIDAVIPVSNYTFYNSKFARFK